MLSDQANLIETDLADGESVADAMAQVDAAFFHLPTLPDATQAINMVQKRHLRRPEDPAQAPGVYHRRLLRRTICPPGDFVTGLRMTSAAFLNSGVDTVVLRPTLYLANLVWPHLLREIRERGRLTYPPLSAKRRLNWTSTEDQGELPWPACTQMWSAKPSISPAPNRSRPRNCARCWPACSAAKSTLHPKALMNSPTHSPICQAARHRPRHLRAVCRHRSDPRRRSVVDTDALEKRLSVKLTPVSQWVEERLGALISLYG